MANKWAIQNGNWSDGSTWNDGVIPTADDDVWANGYNVSFSSTLYGNLYNDTNPSTGNTGGQFVRGSGSIVVNGDVHAGNNTSLPLFSQSGTNRYITINGDCYCGSSAPISNGGNCLIEINGDIYGSSYPLVNCSELQFTILGNCYIDSAIIFNSTSYSYNECIIVGNIEALSNESIGGFSNSKPVRSYKFNGNVDFKRSECFLTGDAGSFTSNISKIEINGSFTGKTISKNTNNSCPPDITITANCHIIGGTAIIVSKQIHIGGGLVVENGCLVNNTYNNTSISIVGDVILDNSSIFYNSIVSLLIDGDVTCRNINKMPIGYADTIDVKAFYYDGIEQIHLYSINQLNELLPQESDVKEGVIYDAGNRTGTYSPNFPQPSTVLKDVEYGDDKVGTLEVIALSGATATAENISVVNLTEQEVNRVKNCATVSTVQKCFEDFKE